jgi:hypothetical protein
VERSEGYDGEAIGSDRNDLGLQGALVTDQNHVARGRMKTGHFSVFVDDAVELADVLRSGGRLNRGGEESIEW